MLIDTIQLLFPYCLNNTSAGLCWKLKELLPYLDCDWYSTALHECGCHAVIMHLKNY